MKYHLNAGGRYFDPGEGLVVYFDPASGDTHLISDFTAYLLQQISGETMEAQDILDRLAPSLHPDDLTDLTRNLPEVLGELVDMGILESL